MVQLPVYGHFGMAVHKGYKIFNLRDGVVTKIFDPDVNQTSILREIEQLKKISQIDFAPFFDKMRHGRKVVRGRIYQEHDTLCASVNRFEHIIESLSRNEAVPCLQTLMAFQSPEVKDLMVYLDELIGIPEVRRLSTEDLPGSEFETIKSFLNDMVVRLREEGKIPIYLVFTHGDFCPAKYVEYKTRNKVY